MQEGRSSTTRRLSYRVRMLCAVIAGTTIYSAAHAQTVGDDQTAFGVPRLALNGAAPGVALPQPLTPSEAARIRHIFALQEAGNIAQAARETGLLTNNLLLGTILADRYLGGWAHPGAAELADWLAKYGDEPDAPGIRALHARLARDTPSTPAAVPASAPKSGKQGGGAIASIRAVFSANRDAAAIAMAEAVLPSATGSAEASFVGGLAAWRSGHLTTAVTLFEATYRQGRGAAQRAAGAYWAARSAQRLADYRTAVMWLRRAAQDIDTFYGRIAARALGEGTACRPNETLTNADIDALTALPEGRRAFGLLQIGDRHRAELELRGLWLRGGPAIARPLALLARALAFTPLAEEVRNATRATQEVALPPQLLPAGGFVVDPPLIYALVRHESNFSPAAVSHSGAVGLMQIKPSTARVVSGTATQDGVHAARLRDPAVNLAVGQQYLLQLSNDASIDGDLIRLLAGYARGLFGLKRLADGVNDQNDPLLFLEAMSNPATRSFIQDTLAWSWHYAAALHAPTPTLDALAAGQVPRLIRIGAYPAVDCRAEAR